MKISLAPTVFLAIRYLTGYHQNLRDHSLVVEYMLWVHMTWVQFPMVPYPLLRKVEQKK